MEKQIDDNKEQNLYSNILFVSDLPNGTKIQDLEILFNNYQFLQGFINNSKINKTWAQVVLENEISANKARHELNGFFLIPLSANNDESKGRPIRICKYELKYYGRKDIDYKKNLLVKNIDTKMSQMEFYNIFLKYGDILSGKIEYEENGMSKGFGYIYYYDEESAENAKNNLNNKEFYGKKMEIVNLIPAKIKKNNNKVTIFALNLPNNATEKEIKSIFGKYGEISYVSLTHKGYAFINYMTHESASACVSDIKKNPICFSGQPNLIVKFATSKEERDMMKNSHKNKHKNDDDECKIFFRLIDNEEVIRNIYDLDKNIRLFIKIIFVTEYIPTSVEVNEKIKCGIVTFHNLKDCELFVTKFLEYCKHRKPMFNCISYNKIKMQITDTFINLENAQNINCYQNGIDSNPNNNDFTKNSINTNIYNMNNSHISNNYMNQKYNNDNIINNCNYFNYNNQNINTSFSNNINNNNYRNNISNYSKLNNNIFDQKNKYQQYNNPNNNNNMFFNRNRNNNHFIFNPYLNNNQNINNVNNSSNNINFMNNYEKNDLLYNDSKEKEKENENIKNNSNYEKLLKSWDFNSPPKCYYNADHIQKDDINEEIIVELSDSIYQIVSEIHPEEAGKITGMIKELGLNKMNLLLSKPDDLYQIIEKAYNMIITNNKNKDNY
jgi:hypothetical protein